MGDIKIVKPSELDIYYQPEEDVRYITVEREPVFLYDAVSSARKRVTRAFSGVLTTHEKISNLKTYLESKFSDLYTAGLIDPYSLLVPSSIALATVTGAVVAGKGRRRIRRTIYAAIFGGTATAVTHPERSLDILETGYYHSVGGLQNLYYSWKSKETITEKVEKENEVTEVQENNLPKVEDDLFETKLVQSDDLENTDSSNILEAAAETVTKEPVLSDAQKDDLEVIVKADMSSDENLNANLDEGNRDVENIDGTSHQAEKVEEMLHISEQVVSANEDEVLTVPTKDSSKESEVFVEENKVIIESEELSSANNSDLHEDNQVSDVIDANAKEKPLQEEMLVITEQLISKNEDKTTEVSSSNEVQVIKKNDSENKVEEDFGQSDPSDNDMYSTRK